MISEPSTSRSRCWVPYDRPLSNTCRAPRADNLTGLGGAARIAEEAAAEDHSLLGVRFALRSEDLSSICPIFRFRSSSSLSPDVSRPSSCRNSRSSALSPASSWSIFLLGVRRFDLVYLFGHAVERLERRLISRGAQGRLDALLRLRPLGAGDQDVLLALRFLDLLRQVAQRSLELLDRVALRLPLVLSPTGTESG